MNLLSALSPIANLKQLRKDKELSTFERLMVSHHVAELRLIFSITLLGMLSVPCLAVLISFAHAGGDVFVAVANSGLIIGAVWAVGCGLLAWTYRTGSARLGVVDLFACEIATLCRVTVVVDTVQHLIDLDKAMPTVIGRFSSQESYFPVFESTVKDLQQLEEKVVKDVTAFYTYMKVMRDYMRKLADIQTAAPGAQERWHTAVSNVIYMLFLGLESARRSIDALVEFQPTRAEGKLTILLSEITAYGYLRRTVTDDLLHQRLEAREAAYRVLIEKLDREVRSFQDDDWTGARDIADQLMKRYELLFRTLAPIPVREPVMA